MTDPSPFQIPDGAKLAIAAAPEHVGERIKMPLWYGKLCARQAKAMWRDEITDRELDQLNVLHQAALAEALDGARPR